MRHHGNMMRMRRRQIQLQSAGPVALGTVLRTINHRGGALAYYRGFLPNAVKNLPNKGLCDVLQQCSDCPDLARSRSVAGSLTMNPAVCCMMDSTMFH